MATSVFKAMPLVPMIGGLLSVAQVNETSRDNPEWSMGVYAWESLACPNSLIITDLCDGSKSGPITSGAAVPAKGWPWGIVLNYTCSTLGYTIEDRRRIVREQIKAGTQKALEHELQTGEAVRLAGHSSVHYLADGDAVVLTSGAYDADLALAALEQALADCGLGTQGVIHMPRAVASLLAVRGSILQTQDRLYTALGTPIVAGTGYTVATSPAAPAAAGPNTAVAPTPIIPGPLPISAWMYATGPVAVHLGKIEVIDEAVDHINNTITSTAVRPAAVYWDSCCHFAAEVDLSP
jgi:hypothetical protein